jgi:uncharacterized UBP type Zn finger protein
MAEHKCSEPDCSEEAVRYCFTCVEYFCGEHTCEHLNSVQYGKSWLSTPAVVERMSDQELADVRLRLVTQLYAIDRELFNRKFDSVKRTGGVPKIFLEDLSEHEVRRFGERKSKSKTGKSKPKASVSKIETAQTISAALKTLKPETMKKVQEAFMRKFGGKS